MIRIMIDKNQRVMDVHGHAGYAEVGSDIVCAAVSGIVQYIELLAYGMLCQGGNARSLRFKESDAAAQRILCAAETALKAIEDQYPDHLTVTVIG